MLACCVILVAISYLMLDIMTGLVVTPKTSVQEVAAEGKLVIPLSGKEILSMQTSADGQYLAYLESTDKGGESALRVVELTGDNPPVFNNNITGKKLAWLGNSYSLVFEDKGDIQSVNIIDGVQINLNGSAEFDGDPIPSPDGRYILWSKFPLDMNSGLPELWSMNNDGSSKIRLAPWADLATWDPASGKVISLRIETVSYAENTYRQSLQIAVPGQSDWNQYTECEGDVRFIWWPALNELLYISPEAIEGQEAFSGVWVWVQDSNSQKKVASTEGLGLDEAYYRFFPNRGGDQLAYVGERGLEYLDYGERIIYRYSVDDAGVPLAWNEAAKEIYYLGTDGIYKVSAKGD
jgi:hypothetical protein